MRPLSPSHRCFPIALVEVQIKTVKAMHPIFVRLTPAPEAELIRSIHSHTFCYRSVLRDKRLIPTTQRSTTGGRGSARSESGTWDLTWLLAGLSQEAVTPSPADETHHDQVNRRDSSEHLYHWDGSLQGMALAVRHREEPLGIRKSFVQICF